MCSLNSFDTILNDHSVTDKTANKCYTFNKLHDLHSTEKLSVKIKVLGGGGEGKGLINNLNSTE